MKHFRKKTILSAFEIAKRDLRANYGHEGIYAGPKNHHEYWARDSFFASYGALSLGDRRIVRKNLDLFVKFQREDGLIPLRVEGRFHPLGFLGINIKHKKLKVVFSPSQPWAGEVIDSNPLFLILASEYAQTPAGKMWISENRKAIMSAVYYLEKRFDQKGLVTEGINAGWADFTFKRGNVLYTNILVWKAFELLCGVLAKTGANYCLNLSDRMETAIKENFWDEKKGFFIDNIGKGERRHEVFASDGNLLSIFLGFATEEEAERIIEYVDKNKLDKVPVPIYYPRLTGKHNLLNRIIFPNYNSTYTFMWWGSISAVARMKTGDNDGAIGDLYSLGKIIKRYGYVPEIVDPKGKVVRKFYYKSERAVSWASGLYVYAVNFARKRGVFELE